VSKKARLAPTVPPELNSTMPTRVASTFGWAPLVTSVTVSPIR
jgi:hypothetical protein